MLVSESDRQHSLFGKCAYSGKGGKSLDSLSAKGTVPEVGCGCGFTIGPLMRRSRARDIFFHMLVTVKLVSGAPARQRSSAL